MGINPSAAPTLKVCSRRAVPRRLRLPVGCPAASKIGTVSIETPALPAGSLPGSVYLGEQLSRNPLSGKEYRVFVNAESARYGVYVRLIGEVKANPSPVG